MRQNKRETFFSFPFKMHWRPPLLACVLIQEYDQLEFAICLTIAGKAPRRADSLHNAWSPSHQRACDQRAECTGLTRRSCATPKAKRGIALRCMGKREAADPSTKVPVRIALKQRNLERGMEFVLEV